MAVSGETWTFTENPASNSIRKSRQLQLYGGARTLFLPKRRSTCLRIIECRSLGIVMLSTRSCLVDSGGFVLKAGLTSVYNLALVVMSYVFASNWSCYTWYHLWSRTSFADWIVFRLDISSRDYGRILSFSVPFASHVWLSLVLRWTLASCDRKQIQSSNLHGNC